MSDSEKLKVTKLVLTFLIVLPNFLGNFFVCLVVLKNKLFRTYINFLLVHLAITDILAGFFALLEALLDIFVHDKSCLNIIFCKLVFNKHFVHIGVISSYSTIILIALFRYFGISKPLKSVKYKNTRNLKFIFPAIWFISLLSLAPRIYADFSKPGCAKLVALPMTSRIGGGISIVFRGIILPTSTLSYTYWKIKKALIARQNGTHISRRQQAALNSKRKATHLLGFIILVFVVCSVPYYLYAVGRSIFSFHNLASYVYVEMLLFCIYVAGSSINPFLYWFHCKRFRRTVFKYFERLSNRIAPN